MNVNGTRHGFQLRFAPVPESEFPTARTVNRTFPRLNKAIERVAFNPAGD